MGSAPTAGLRPAAEAGAPDLERRFGALGRLYGQAAYERLRAGRVAVVGLGGVGSWAVEALARSGVGTLVLVDFDHVAESNINRQVQATEATLGQAKGEALRERIAGIHPGCRVIVVDEFVGPDANHRRACRWPTSPRSATTRCWRRCASGCGARFGRRPTRVWRASRPAPAVPPGRARSRPWDCAACTRASRCSGPRPRATRPLRRRPGARWRARATARA